MFGRDCIPEKCRKNQTNVINIYGVFDSLLSITLFTVATITLQKPITEDMYIIFSPISLDHHLLTNISVTE